MKISRAKRPKRLWIVCGMNIFASVVSLSAIVLTFIGPNEVQALRPDALGVVIASSLAAFLLASSILGLLGVPQARWLILVSALLFYGGIAVQNLYILASLEDALSDKDRLKLWSHVGRSTIEVSLNLWMCLSSKVVTFFASAPVSIASNSSLQAPHD
jgi:hypothetical protein